MTNLLRIFKALKTEQDGLTASRKAGKLALNLIRSGAVQEFEIIRALVSSRVHFLCGSQAGHGYLRPQPGEPGRHTTNSDWQMLGLIKLGALVI